MRRLLFGLFLCLFFLFPLVSCAETAEELTDSCHYSASDTSKLFRLTDGKTKQIFEGRANRENWIEITAPQGKAMAGLYILWKGYTSPVTMEVTSQTGEVSIQEVNAHFLHEYIVLPQAKKVRLVSTDKKGTLAILELRVFGEGHPPEDVQVWQDAPDKNDLLVFVAHPDDEYIFLGGTIPYYCVERKLQVVVCYMTCKDEFRLHELLNGLWTAGCHTYPELLDFEDKLCSQLKTAYKYWGGIDAALDGVAQMLERTRPDVVITQDTNGEYGHGGHMGVADLSLRIIRDEERTLSFRPQKLYLHLFPERPIMMDWDQPLTDMNGLTSLDLAKQAFACHVSQQGYSHETRSGKKFRFEVVSHGMFDNASFGLAYSSVGDDVYQNDFMENVIPSLP